jgi:hypothetical protein
MKGEAQHALKEEARAHNNGYREALRWMKEPERIEDHENDDDPNLVTVHPYWKPEHTDRYLGLVEANLRLLRAIWPWEKEP